MHLGTPSDNKGMDEAEFQELREQYEEAKTSSDEAKGALSTLRDRLKKEFGLKNVKEAREQLRQMNKRVLELEKNFQAELAKYRRRFPND